MQSHVPAQNSNATPVPLLASSDAVADLLAAGHAVRVRVQGRSMRPFIADGAVLTLVPSDAAGLHLGEVALYRAAGGRIACHRLLARRHEHGALFLGFGGDAFCDALEWIEATRIVGKAMSREGRRRPMRLDTRFRRWTGWAHARLRRLSARMRIGLGAWRRRIMAPRGPQGGPPVS